MRSSQSLAGAGRKNQDGLVNGDPVGAPEAESVEHLCFALGIRHSIHGGMHSVVRRTHSA